MGAETDPGDWKSAWPDLVAFGSGLTLAWWAGWDTTDLVWSLWLASLLVGYSIIIWSVTSPLRSLWRGAANEPAPLPAGIGAGSLVLGAGALFMLAFFTIHFGGFHYVHSVFLNSFFPVTSNKGPLGLSDFAEILKRYWIWLPVAFLAERRAFFQPSASGKTQLAAPYKNVVRLHLLIFFFAFAHFMKLESFIVYAVVYVVYFFPWRLLRKRGRES